MKKSNLWILLAVGLILVVTVFSLSLISGKSASQSPNSGAPAENNSNDTAQTDSTNEISNISSMGVALVEQNGSGVSGAAQLIGEAGKTKVVIEVTGFGTEDMPAHIHAGSCPTPGEVKFPLNSVKNGKSETIIDVELKELIPELPLAINLHKSASDMQTYTACGDLPASE